MYVGHNASARDLIFMTDETERVRVRGNGGVRVADELEIGYVGSNLYSTILGPSNRTLRIDLKNNNDADTLDVRYDASNGGGPADTVAMSVGRGGVEVTGELTIGGGYGSSGVTISSAGNLDMDGDLTVDGSASVGSLSTSGNIDIITGQLNMTPSSSAHSYLDWDTFAHGLPGIEFLTARFQHTTISVTAYTWVCTISGALSEDTVFDAIKRFVPATDDFVSTIGYHKEEGGAYNGLLYMIRTSSTKIKFYSVGGAELFQCNDGETDDMDVNNNIDEAVFMLFSDVLS
jgi:hypothetical protein